MHARALRQAHAAVRPLALEGELASQLEAEHLIEELACARGIGHECTRVTRAADVERGVDRPDGLQMRPIDTEHHDLVGRHPMGLADVVGRAIGAGERHNRHPSSRLEAERLDDRVASIKIAHRETETERAVETTVESRSRNRAIGGHHHDPQAQGLGYFGSRKDEYLERPGARHAPVFAQRSGCDPVEDRVRRRETECALIKTPNRLRIGSSDGDRCERSAHDSSTIVSRHHRIGCHGRKLSRAAVPTSTAERLHLHLMSDRREFFYRFRAGDFTSPIGRTWTAAALGQNIARLRIGVASCQHYEQGYYHAYQHMLERGTDLILHLGDYIYEGNTGDPVRQHDRGECRSLAEYRRRYAWYRTDPLLRAAHAACPWLVTHDDHEVDNDYAGAQSENPREQADFLARRAAAYRAYWEHMPLPRSALPRGPDMQLYMSRALGDLVAVHMLDERQYRSPQACPAPPRLGGSRVFVDTCPNWNDPSRTMLGATQENWVDAQLRASKARWNLVAQGVVMTLIDEDPGPRQQHWSDSWAGYPAARQRLLQSVANSGCANPVLLGGDIHAFIAADQRLVPNDPSSPIIGSEFVTTSISSGPPPQKVIDAYNRGDSTDVFFADGSHRGYLHLTVTPTRLEADLVGYDSVREKQAVARSLARFTLEDGQRGLRKG
ncbi:MAG: hypothetical protein EB048_06135 [Gammaproteobacteria bacterium]|nr:hypothetical protein [Gammaproteobacteria bacterium]